MYPQCLMHPKNTQGNPAVQKIIIVFRNGEQVLGPARVAWGAWKPFWDGPGRFYWSLPSA